jgi:hypothetical protein
MTDRTTVSRWLVGYEAAWRASGTGSLTGLFTGGATYLQSPYEQPVAGLDAISQMCTTGIHPARNTGTSG